jgi:23S rRNA pseudouridine1911/1915/1917 synthase
MYYNFVMTQIKDKKTFIAKPEDDGVRLDKFLVGNLPDETRQNCQKLIESGMVLIDGKTVKSSRKIKSGDRVEVVFPPPREMKLKPLDMKLDIVYEDANVIVINKPAGLVVHPGAGESHMEDSLVNAILYHCKDSLSGIGGVMRPGIVHRLDKDTSGLLIVAKNDKAHRLLSEQFKDHKAEKTYYALLSGHLVPEKGSIEAPIGRSVRDRKRMDVVALEKGRMAVTKYRVLKYLGDYTFVEVKLITGRTHQIRVHFNSIGFPLVGDSLYGRLSVNKKVEQEYGFNRLFLHAGGLTLNIAVNKKKSFSASLPKELEDLLKKLSE